MSTALERKLHDLANLPQETEWVQFMINKAEPDEIGEYISALSNAAALAGCQTHGVRHLVAHGKERRRRINDGEAFDLS